MNFVIDFHRWAWAPGKDVHWIVPVLAGVPFGWGTLTIFVGVLFLWRERD